MNKKQNEQHKPQCRGSVCSGMENIFGKIKLCFCVFVYECNVGIHKNVEKYHIKVTCESISSSVVSRDNDRDISLAGCPNTPNTLRLLPVITVYCYECKCIKIVYCV